MASDQLTPTTSPSDWAKTLAELEEWTSLQQKVLLAYRGQLEDQNALRAEIETLQSALEQMKTKLVVTEAELHRLNSELTKAHDELGVLHSSPIYKVIRLAKRAFPEGSRRQRIVSRFARMARSTVNRLRRFVIR